MGPLALNHFLVLGALLFAISVVGIFLNRRNIIVLLMAIELMLLAVNLNFVAFSHFLGDLAGQVFVFFILTVAAAESGPSAARWKAHAANAGWCFHGRRCWAGTCSHLVGASSMASPHVDSCGGPSPRWPCQRCHGSFGAN
jgi:NADH-quinone oxidoreductase subunit K